MTNKKTHLNKSVCLIILIALVQINAQIISRGLIGYYPFTKGSYKDECGKIGDLTPSRIFSNKISAKPYRDRFNNDSCSYLLFRDTLGYRAMGFYKRYSESIIPPHSDFTISYWVKEGFSVAEAPPYIYVLSIGDSLEKKENTLYIMERGSYYIKFNNDSIPIVDIGDSNWYFICITSKNDTIKTYARAINSNRISYNKKYCPISIQSSGMFSIGGPYNGICHYSSIIGAVDDITIYNRALDTLEIEYLYKCSSYTNKPPVINIPNQNIEVLKEFMYTINISDEEPSEVSLTLVKNNNIGLKLTNNILSWTPTLSEIGNYHLSIIAKDKVGDSSTCNFTISVSKPANNPPIITSKPDTIAVPNQEYTYKVTATDPENSSITISLVEVTPYKPSSMTFTNNTLRWTPNGFDNGKKCTIKISAKDSYGDSSVQIFNLIVTNSTEIINKISSITNNIKENNTIYYMINGKKADIKTINLKMNIHKKLILVKKNIILK